MKPRSKEDVDTGRFLDAWFNVRQMIQAANFNRFNQAGLSATQFMTLNLLPEHDEGMSVGELARRMNLKPATVAKTIDSLELRKLVSRMRGESDRRIVLVRLTKDGRKFQNSAAGQLRDQMNAVFCALSPARRVGLIEGLEGLVEAARALNRSNQPPASDRPDVSPQAKRSSRRSPAR